MLERPSHDRRNRITSPKGCHCDHATNRARHKQTTDHQCVSDYSLRQVVLLFIHWLLVDINNCLMTSLIHLMISTNLFVGINKYLLMYVNDISERFGNITNNLVI